MKFWAESAPGLKFAIFPTRAAARAEKSKWAGLARAVARAEIQISNFSIKNPLGFFKISKFFTARASPG